MREGSGEKYYEGRMSEKLGEKFDKGRMMEGWGKSKGRNIMSEGWGKDEGRISEGWGKDEGRGKIKHVWINPLLTWQIFNALFTKCIGSNPLHFASKYLISHIN